MITAIKHTVEYMLARQHSQEGVAEQEVVIHLVIVADQEQEG
jgi:hypothetical protein